jgi:soluble lytic murein transglycosylase
MRGPHNTKFSSLLPEATILFMVVGVGFVLSNMGTQARLNQRPKALLARSALPPFTPPLSPTPLLAPKPAAVFMPPAQVLASGQPAAQAPKISLPANAPALVVSPKALAAEATRIEHARELMGKFYDRSVVKSSEKVGQLDRFVRQWTDRALKREFKKYSKAIADTVLSESSKHDFDPVFLMAVIENESSFDPHIVGSVGEIGLMQVTPATGEWIAKKFGIKWEGKKSLRDPRTNIRIGAAYLSYLREEFDSHSQLYLAAYNMGSLNVNRALEKSIWPKDYPQRVMKRYIRFYGDLKAEIKNEARPKG